MSRLRLLPRIPLADYRDWGKVRLLWRVKPYTVMPYSRLANIYELSRFLNKEGLAGSFVECGVMNGGSAGIIASLAHGKAPRSVWLFDSWEGLPEPGEHDIDFRGEKGQKGIALGSEARVRDLLFQRLRLSPERIHMMRGWFQNTVPVCREQIGAIALLHLDCDWYESLQFCLETLYDLVVPGGIVVVDDYGYWRGSRVALEEFLARRQLTPTVQRVDIAVWFRK
jgi:hypothetical protein